MQPKVLNKTKSEEINSDNSNKWQKKTKQKPEFKDKLRRNVFHFFFFSKI